MNFSNENVLIIAVLIGIIIMFLSSGCLCKNNTEQFIDILTILATNKNNAAKAYEDIKKKSSDTDIVYNAIMNISNAMNKAKTTGKNNVEIMNAFNASKAITNSTNNITSTSAVSSIKILIEPILKAVDASKIQPNIKMSATGIELVAKTGVTDLTTAINNARITANSAKIIDDGLVLNKKYMLDQAQIAYDNNVRNNKK